MATKLQTYAQLAEHSAAEMTKSREQWTSFLETASRLYKYPFTEQLMIYAQRPDAKACAPLEVWNNPMNRWVKRGSKGIALLDHSGEKPRLKYVFDMADTDIGWREAANESHSRRPFIWELREEYETSVMEALANAYDKDVQGDLGNILYEIAGQLATDYYEDHKQDINFSIEGSFLGDLDAYNVEVAYQDALTVSVAYSLMSRCGLDAGDYIENEDFMPIFDFNTADAVTALGTGVSELTEQVLREIEITIKNHERQKAVERSETHGELDLFRERRVSDSRPDPHSELGGNDRQVRSDAPELPSKPQSNIVQFPSFERSPVPTLDRDQPDGGTTIGAVDVGADTAEPASGEGERPDGLGAAHEQPETTSGGNDSHGTDPQLNTYPSMDDAALNKILIQSGLETLDVDNILRAASNNRHSDQRIYLKYAHGLPPEEIASFLQREFHTGGRGLQIGTTEVSAWWDKDGLLIGTGRTALQANDRIFLTWSQVESRIRDLIENRAYLSAELVESATENEHRRLANQLVFSYRDDMQGIIATPEEWEENGTGYPDMEAKVMSLLSEPVSRDRIITALQADYQELQNRTHERRWYIHDVNRLITDLQEWQRPPVPLETEPLPPSGFPFITEDEVDAYLCRGSSVTGSKGRLIHHFLNEHTLKESADFLKDEYGTGGSSNALRSDDSWEDHGSKGITLTRGGISNPHSKIEMNWNKVARRIDTLINEGRFFTRAELDAFREQYVKNLIASNVRSFYYDVPEALIPSDADGLYLSMFASSEQIDAFAKLLDDPVRVNDITDAMERAFQQLDISTRNYESKINSLNMVQSFRENRLDLIPQLSSVPVPDVIMSTLANLPPTRTETPSHSSADIPPMGNEQMQLSFFPSEQEQRETVAVSEGLPTSAFSITEDEIDAVIVNALENPETRQRMVAQFEANPRSREATALLRAEYSSLAYTMPRADGIEGYLGLLGDASGIVVTKGAALTGSLSERQPVDSITLPWGKVQRRVAELVESEAFQMVPTQEEQPKEVVSENEISPQIIKERVGIALNTRGYAVSEELLEIGWEDFYLHNEAGDVIDIADFIEKNHLKDNPYLHENEPPQQPIHEPISAGNFRITDNNLGHGGAKAKHQMNVDAIRTLKQIESENRLATIEEQETLSKYVGWGGLAQAFDDEKEQWSKEYIELRELLSEDEYTSARASTLNAHYTSPMVIKAIYDAVESMGFKGGNILEPACGIGNFFGLLPESMANSKLYGVELDSITGRIAKQLYQDADIRITGFEKTETPDALFDLAIGNVPFGNYSVPDKRYDKNHFAIHDYFFGKALDQVRPGGVIAFITTKGTLDKANPDVRKYIAQRAELLGAVRLPNDAFLQNAGTQVTTDIIFLQKRDRMMDIQPDWVHLGQTEDGVPVNSYFAEHPEMILGTMVFDESMYGKATDTACHPIEGADLAEQLQEAVRNIHGQIAEIEFTDADAPQDTSLPADPSVRNYSYTLVNDTVYFRENSRMYAADLPTATLERIKGMVQIRDCVHELIAYQLDEYGDHAIAEKQAELNQVYDAFAKKHGLINASANNKAFANDSAYYLLCSLEILDENGELDRKADMFTKRTIKQNAVITSVDTASEALAVSIAERAKVDLEYMQTLSGLSEETLIADLQGVIYRDTGEGYSIDGVIPDFDWESKPFVTADEYLSGNVRRKLKFAEHLAEAYPEIAHSLAPNIEALKQSQPKDLDASEIAVRLGTTWIDKKYVEQFVHETLQPPDYLKDYIHVNYFDYTGEWNIASTRRVPGDNVLANVTYGTKRMSAYRIIEDTLNLKDVRVYDTRYVDGKEVRELNKKETTLAQQKQEALKQAFNEWIFKDPERRRDLVQFYNERFNATRPREYDGSHISFPGISPDITLRPHQLNAIAHELYGGNTLLAHEVGAGKTFEMVAAAMELKRLGLAQKSMFAVPNHLTEQWASEFFRLYPSANILVATAKDFEMKNRKKFCGKIATGDYDAVILGHSQLEKIPLSQERQERLLREQIGEITEGIDELKRNEGERFSIKQLEKTRKSLETRLKKLTDDSRKDDVVNFEQLGVDRLFVDEAHSFKNLFLYTKMRNVAGISQTEAQKSSDLFGKCRYLDELTGGKGVIFATGTPISNSMTEMYTMQRYLQYDTLRKNGLVHFDAWASTFGETTTAIELAPEGTGYRARTRFAKFHNLPELMCMFKEVADIKTADMMDLPRPKANYNTVVVKPTELQKGMVKELSARAAIVHNKGVDPHEDNMLKITSDGRKIGLDQRLINPMLPDEEGSKVNACANNVLRIWEDTKADKLTQLLFCDFSTPNKDGRFNVYDDIREKLLEKGIPENEIAYIHDANTEVRKKELFAKVRQGKVRVLFGSTFKMGSGTNVQDRLIHLHDLDCPWRPSDLEQRSGRIVRQGNMNPEVGITRYVTEGTFDAYLYQTIENKQKFISQIMSSKSPVRSCEDVDETALSYAEIKALCAGNPLIREKMDLDIEVARLRLLKADHQSQRYKLEDDLLTNYPRAITKAQEQITGFQKDAVSIEQGTRLNSDGFSPMRIGNTTYSEKSKAGTALLEACKHIKGTDPVNIGNYRGLDMLLSFDSYAKTFHISMKGAMSYSCDLGTDTFGNITRINNVIGDLPNRLNSVQKHLENVHHQVQNAEGEKHKPFPYESELNEKAARLAFLDAELNMDTGKQQGQDTVESHEEHEPQAAIAKGKPSLMERLKNAAIDPKPSAVKPKTADISL